MPGFYAYPGDPEPVSDRPPAEGLGKITINYPTYIAAPPGPDRNTFYAQLQEEIGAELDLTAIPNADYRAKFQTMIAGGDLPDLMMFPLPTPDQPRVLDRMFADLGPYLAGDAALDFPYLANIPTNSWRPTVSNGTIFAVPQPRSVSGEAMYFRRDVLEQLDLKPEPADYTELVELYQAVTNPRESRWAVANAGHVRAQIAEMLGAPNGWSESGGVFTSAWGDERTKEGIARVAELIKLGVFHPDAASANHTQYRDFFFAGRTVFLSDGYAGWDLFVRQLGGVQEGTAKLGMMILPKFDGGGDAGHFAGNGYQGITVIKGGLGEEKTRMLLNVLNFLAARECRPAARLARADHQPADLQPHHRPVLRHQQSQGKRDRPAHDGRSHRDHVWPEHDGRLRRHLSALAFRRRRQDRRRVRRGIRGGQRFAAAMINSFR